MKMIYENNVDSISASSENASFPATNLLNEHPKSKFKAANSAASSTIITASIVGGANALGMVGITADAATVTIADPNATAWEAGTAWETGTSWSATVPDLDIQIEWIEDTENSLWVDFSAFYQNADVMVTLHKEAGADPILAAGVIVCGLTIDVENPGYGFNVGQHDYSIQEELSNGSLWYKKRDVVKVVSGEIFVTLAQYRELLINIRTLGKTPTMWSVLDDYTGNELIIFGRLTDMPSYAMVSRTHARFNFSIIEVL